MSTLHDRLADLAEEAPTAGTAPGARTGLWERGLRYRRVRRAGTLAVLGTAVLVLALLGGITWHRAAPPIQPASGQVGLPDRVWDPSPWLPTSSRPGRLVAMTTADRGSWTGKKGALLGVSATTGRYAFLEDLPDLAPDKYTDAVLAPDGRHVAYWLTGSTTGTPNTASGPVTGVGIYDTTNGHVSRHWIRTPHGLMTDFLTWASNDSVVFAAAQYFGGDDASARAQNSGRQGPTEVVTLGGQPEPLPAGVSTSYVVGAAHGWLLASNDSSRSDRPYRLLDLTGRSSGRYIGGLPDSGTTFGNLHPVAVDQSGTRFAGVTGGSSPNKVVVDRSGDVQPVPNTRGTFAVADWLDADTIVTLRREPSHVLTDTALYRVSVTTGRSTKLVNFPRFSTGGGWQFATDLLGAPSVHAHEPPHPVDPRWVTGLAATTVLAAIAGLVLWRRRVRP